MPTPTMTISEVEGADRWSVQLVGRARPRNDKERPEFGVSPTSAVTRYAGRQVGEYQPLALDFPELAFAGEWKANQVRDGTARIVFGNGRGAARTPHAACLAMEQFAIRGKVLEVTLSAGVSRLCVWGPFTWGFGRGGDRTWRIALHVLGLAAPPSGSASPPVTSRAALSSLKGGAQRLDSAILTYPAGLAPSFAERFSGAMNSARAAMASVRKQVHEVGDFAKAPAGVLRQLSSVAHAARGTLVDALDVFQDVAYEHQVAIADARSILAVRTWRGTVVSAAADTLDVLYALALSLERHDRPAPKRFVPVNAGDSLVRVAIAQYGPGNGDLWAAIANANGLASQIVPAGVGRLLVPEL